MARSRSDSCSLACAPSPPKMGSGPSWSNFPEERLVDLRRRFSATDGPKGMLLHLGCAKRTFATIAVGR